MGLEGLGLLVARRRLTDVGKRRPILLLFLVHVMVAMRPSCKVKWVYSACIHFEAVVQVRANKKLLF